MIPFLLSRSTQLGWSSSLTQMKAIYVKLGRLIFRSIEITPQASSGWEEIKLYAPTAPAEPSLCWSAHHSCLRVRNLKNERRVIFHWLESKTCFEHGRRTRFVAVVIPGSLTQWLRLVPTTILNAFLPCNGQLANPKHYSFENWCNRATKHSDTRV